MTALEKDAAEDMAARERLGKEADVPNTKIISMPHKKPPSMVFKWLHPKDRRNKKPDSSDGIGRH